MQGLIGNREALAHLPLIWREFGSGCAFRCIKAVLTGKRTTFLEMTRSPCLTVRDPLDLLIEKSSARQP